MQNKQAGVTSLRQLTNPEEHHHLASGMPAFSQSGMNPPSCEQWPRPFDKWKVDDLLSTLEHLRMKEVLVVQHQHLLTSDSASLASQTPDAAIMASLQPASSASPSRQGSSSALHCQPSDTTHALPNKEVTPLVLSITDLTLLMSCPLEEENEGEGGEEHTFGSMQRPQQQMAAADAPDSGSAPGAADSDAEDVTGCLSAQRCSSSALRCSNTYTDASAAAAPTACGLSNEQATVAALACSAALVWHSKAVCSNHVPQEATYAAANMTQASAVTYVSCATVDAEAQLGRSGGKPGWAGRAAWVASMLAAPLPSRPERASPQETAPHNQLCQLVTAGTSDSLDNAQRRFRLSRLLCMCAQPSVVAGFTTDVGARSGTKTAELGKDAGQALEQPLSDKLAQGAVSTGETLNSGCNHNNLVSSISSGLSGHGSLVALQPGLSLSAIHNALQPSQRNTRTQGCCNSSTAASLTLFTQGSSVLNVATQPQSCDKQPAMLAAPVSLLQSHMTNAWTFGGPTSQLPTQVASFLPEAHVRAAGSPTDVPHGECRST